MDKISKIKHPELFQGKDKDKNYFEGWYFKHIDQQGVHVFSIIPGINSEHDKSSCFIQIITGPQSKSYYLHYDIKDFSWSDNPFSVSIGDNSFSLTGIKLNIETQDVNIKGEIQYDGITSLKSNILSPNIMGAFAYLKNMECNHGVLSLYHNLSGEIKFNESKLDFNNGIGYIEKDWGTSFPKSYCWVQCNSFDEKEISLFLSVANIPFAYKSFTGYICILMIGDKQYRFATYNFSKIITLDFIQDKLNVTFKKGKYKLEISCSVINGRVLKAPKDGIMDKDIKESVQGVVQFRLYKKDQLLYSAIGKPACVEVVDI